MDRATPMVVCRILGLSIRGAVHVRRGQPCQDAFAHWSEAPDRAPAVVAVADGHGSPASFRSDIGAKLATDTALVVFAEFNEAFGGGSAAMAKRAAEERLPGEIARLWATRVRAHAQAEPFTTGELAAWNEGGDLTVRAKLESNPLVAYGTTLLVAAVLKAGIVFLQLGDGDILSVGATGKLARPVSADERAFANETPSLCMRDAGREMRSGFLAAGSGTPGLILLSTDGYANCFASDEDFERVGPDLLRAIEKYGPERMESVLRNQLEEASRRFSGDDITVAMIWFPEAKKREAPCRI